MTAEEVATDTVTEGVPGGERRRGRYAPGFAVVAALACLPPALTAGPGGGVDRAFLFGAAVLAGIGVVAQAARRQLDSARRDRIGTWFMLACAIWLTVLVARSTLPAHDLLGHLAALQVTTVAIRRRGPRAAVQAAILLGTALLLVRDIGALAEVEPISGVLGPVGLVFVVTVMAGAMADDLDRSRRTAAAIAARAAVRAELLATVRRVAQAEPRQVHEATVAGLLTLGFDVAAVAVLRGDEFVPERVEGLGWRDPLPVDHPHLQRLLRAQRPLIFDDYAAEADALAGVSLGTVLLAPVRAEDRTVALLMAGHRDAGEPEDADVEVTDVLAAHLGAVLLAERAERRQRELLARLRELDSLREGFVSQVTDDLRDPLTVVRLIAQGLVTHGEQMDAGRREELADQLASQAAGLERTIEALLDLSRGAPSADGAPEVADLLELLAPALRGSGVAVAGQARGAVLVDVTLVRRAIEVLRRAELDLDRPLELAEGDGEVVVTLHLRRLDELEGDIARSVGEQLAVAGGAHVEREGDRVRLHLPRADLAVGGSR